MWDISPVPFQTIERIDRTLLRMSRFNVSDHRFIRSFHAFSVNCVASSESAEGGIQQCWCFITRSKACFTVHSDHCTTLIKYSSLSVLCPRLCLVYTHIRHAFVPPAPRTPIFVCWYFKRNKRHNSILRRCVIKIGFRFWALSQAVWVVCSIHLSQFVWCSSSI